MKSPVRWLEPPRLRLPSVPKTWRTTPFTSTHESFPDVASSETNPGAVAMGLPPWAASMSTRISPGKGGAGSAVRRRALNRVALALLFSRVKMW